MNVVNRPSENFNEDEDHQAIEDKKKVQLNRSLTMDVLNKKSSSLDNKDRTREQDHFKSQETFYSMPKSQIIEESLSFL